MFLVRQHTNEIVERLGKFHKVLQPGLYFLIPIIDRRSYIHEMREHMLWVEPQSVITNDNIQVGIDGLLYIKIMDAKRASYGIGSYVEASKNLAQTTMRSEVGKLSLGQIFAERNTLNKKIIEEIDKASEAWGVKVLRYEIQDIKPSQHVIDTLEKQMEAEREKRSEITLATAEKEKLINVSAGEKIQAINISKGEKQKRINEAAGEAQAIRIMAIATAKSIELIGRSINLPSGDEAVKMRLIDQYLEKLDTILTDCNVSIYPAEFATLKGLFDEMKGKVSS